MKTISMFDKLVGTAQLSENVLDTVEFLTALECMDERMIDVKRDYQIKDQESQMEAVQVTLTA